MFHLTLIADQASVAGKLGISIEITFSVLTLNARTQRHPVTLLAARIANLSTSRKEVTDVRRPLLMFDQIVDPHALFVTQNGTLGWFCHRIGNQLSYNRAAHFQPPQYVSGLGGQIELCDKQKNQPWLGLWERPE